MRTAGKCATPTRRGATRRSTRRTRRSNRGGAVVIDESCDPTNKALCDPREQAGEKNNGLPVGIVAGCARKDIAIHHDRWWPLVRCWLAARRVSRERLLALTVFQYSRWSRGADQSIMKFLRRSSSFGKSKKSEAPRAAVQNLDGPPVGIQQNLDGAAGAPPSNVPQGRQPTPSSSQPYSQPMGSPNFGQHPNFGSGGPRPSPGYAKKDAACSKHQTYQAHSRDAVIFGLGTLSCPVAVL